MIGFFEDGGKGRETAAALAGQVDALFGREGALTSKLGLDHRPQQAAMAHAVARALESNRPLLFEAGTGVGKSLAYLVPGLLRAIESRRPFIVSTHTISLQEQILKKDLKLCGELFRSLPDYGKYGDFKTALMVGRANYCCTTRLSRALEDVRSGGQTELFDGTEKTELERLAEWAATSGDGLLQELSPPPPPAVWEAVHADSSTCSPKNCDPNTCFYRRARKRLMEAHCIILNHSLLFSLLNAGMSPGEDSRGVLLPDDFMVLDEAHRLPSIATEHFGANVSSFALSRALKRLHDPAKGRGVFRKYGRTWDMDSVDQALHASREFFQNLEETFLSNKSIQRIHEPDFTENILSAPLKEVAERLAGMIERVDDERAHDELRDHRRRILGYRDAINGFLSFAEEDHVRWLEKTGKGGRIVTMRGAPLDVAPPIRDALFERGTAAVLTSATLSDGSRMDAFQEKTGAAGVDACLESSPFDYERNCRVYIATDCPAPEPGAGRMDLDYLANMICWCARHVEGGTLVLFTSHFDLGEVRRRTEEFFAKLDRPLFTQGHGHARGELGRRFAEAGNGVLFGTDSFWTGVDVPGPALSQVILTRLPFEHPGHPVSEARSEAIRSRGGNPFTEMVVPDALIKFRQGIGRLIRRSDDTGNIVILDSRILRKPYGKRFLNALPVSRFERFDRFNRQDVFS